MRVVEVERPASPGQAAPRAAVPRVPEAPRSRGGKRPQQDYPPRVARRRSSLLDLSFRNPLLNMRAGRTSLDLHVPRAALGTVEDLLFEGRSLNLIPHDQLAEIHQAQGARTAQDMDPEALRVLLEGGDVFVACTAATCPSRLRGIQRRARTVVEETGANNLFVTLGVLEREDAGREARAPLFLLPVTITARGGRGFTLQIDDGAYAQPNQCLLEKLRIAHGLSIPEFSDPDADAAGIDLAGSLQAIRMALVAGELPFAIEESAHVSLLQFSTLQLWQDLSENWETFMQNDLEAAGGIVVLVKCDHAGCPDVLDLLALGDRLPAGRISRGQARHPERRNGSFSQAESDRRPATILLPHHRTVKTNSSQRHDFWGPSRTS